MSVKSTLVTCPSDSTIKACRIIDMPSTVSEDTLVVDEKADKLYQSINKDYDKIIKEFGYISEEYTKASKFAKGKMRKAYVKVAKKCSDQINFCKRRKKNLEDSYSFSKTQGAVTSLEEAVGFEKITFRGSDKDSEPVTIDLKTEALHKAERSREHIQAVRESIKELKSEPIPQSSIFNDSDTSVNDAVSKK